MSHLLYVHSLSTTVEMEVANPGLRHLIVTIATTHLLEAWSGNQYYVIAVSPKWTASKWKGLAVRGWNFEGRWRKLRSWPMEKCLSNMWHFENERGHCPFTNQRPWAEASEWNRHDVVWFNISEYISRWIFSYLLFEKNFVLASFLSTVGKPESFGKRKHLLRKCCH